MRDRFVLCISLLLLATALAISGAPAFAAFTQYDIETYDLDQGVPKFVDVNYIDLLKITKISIFRSNAGHDYSDSTQFGLEAIKTPDLPVEGCRSMKHYFVAPDATTRIYAPVSGVVSRMFDESIGGTQVQITSDVQNAFTFIIFHVVLTSELRVGDHVTAGQVLGHHTGPQTFSDIAVEVHTPTGYHLISYFDTLTDIAFAPYVERGVATRDQLIYSRAQTDALPSPCIGSNAINVTYPPSYFDLNRGAADHVITATLPPVSVRLTDPPLNLAPVSSVGLPVAAHPDGVSVCNVVGQFVHYNRAGVCKLILTQAGDATHLAAAPLRISFTILPEGVELRSPPRLGGVFPQSETGTQSYLRFYNSGTAAGTVTVSLFDGGSGNTVAKWTSPAIAVGTERQFSIADLETAAAPGFVRSSVYGLRIEPETTITSGTFQHVLFNPVTRVLTNASSCSAGVVGNPTDLIAVHTSRLADSFPSSLIYVNGSSFAGSAALELYSADTGARLGTGAYASRIYYPSGRNGAPISTHGEFVTSVTGLESIYGLTPSVDSYHYVAKASNLRPADFVRHLVSSPSVGVISDMTTQCDLGGLFSHTTRLQLTTGSIYSSDNASGHSYLRFYNPASYEGTVTVVLYDSAKGGANIGQWTSPPIPAGALVQFPMGNIEAAIGLTKSPSYFIEVYSSFYGYFQHALWRAPDGAISNFSTCSGSVMTDPKVLLAVHSSGLASIGYPSRVIVNNTGAAAAGVTLGIYNGATGEKLGSFKTASIPANGQLQFTSTSLESAARVTPDSVVGLYVVKAEEAFSGFLQHYVNNVATGAITDMTLMCAM